MMDLTYPGPDRDSVRMEVLLQLLSTDTACLMQVTLARVEKAYICTSCPGPRTAQGFTHLPGTHNHGR
jgi:hypothetical protein